MKRSIVQCGIICRLCLILVIAGVLSGVPVQTVSGAGVRFAKPSATGTGDCSSWANACDLQTALAGAVSGDEIWVMAGTYIPTLTGDRTATFQLRGNVGVYGGFNGTESTRAERRPGVNVVILSGDLNGDDSGFTNNDENSYHVVTGTAGATLDGLTISGGNANGTTSPHFNGGGLRNGSSMTVKAVIFTGNRGIYGGGMYNSGNTTLTEVSFIGNVANVGGGLLNSWAFATLFNVSFIDNTAIDNDGGGMFSDNGNVSLVRVTFSGNTAGREGGGIAHHFNSLTLGNVTFSNNSAQRGGGIYAYGIVPELTHVTLQNNSASIAGGGIYNDGFAARIKNSIFWGNTAPSGSQIYDSGDTSILSNCVVQGGFPGANIRTDDPLLGTLGNYGGKTQTIPLLPGSSAIKRTSSDCAPADQRGITRGTTCDLGAFESQGFTLAKSGGDNQEAFINTTFPAPLSVTVSSAFGEPVNGGQVTFTAPETGASITTTLFQLTIAGGAVSQSVTANGIPGAYTVTAASRGAATTEDFALENLPSILYAAPGGLSSGYCESWANACEFRYALSRSVSGQEIWVKAGTYTPTSTGERTATFQLKTDVPVYGGFDGTESDRADRDPAANVVILSGDLDGDDSGYTHNDENSYHVVTGADGTTLDGVTVSGGNANGTAVSSDGYGGGLFNDSGSPTLSSVTFSGNAADVAGGGLANFSGSPTLTNVTFSGNLSGASGGGMYNESGSPALGSISFLDNVAQYGGGMYDEGSATLTNVTFSGNTAAAFGGGMTTYGSSATLTNVTFSDNDAADYGGGIACIFNNPQIRNAVFWGNTASTDAQIYQSASSLTVQDSVVQGGYAGGTHILTEDPLLGALGDYGGVTQTIPLQPNSSAIDTANGSFCPLGDQREVLRPQGSRCDIGAYEFILNGGLPMVTGFSAASPSGSLEIPITAFDASTARDVAGYLITTSPTPPPANAAGWSGTAPTTFTVLADGAYTLYPWVKNADGNSSAVFSAPPLVIVDTTGASVISISRENPSPTDANSVGFTVTFNEPVTGVEAGDFSLTTSGISGAAVTGVSGTGSVYSVTVDTGSGNGTIRLDVPVDAVIPDQVGNPLANLPFTGGETYIIDKGFMLFLPLIRR